MRWYGPFLLPQVHTAEYWCVCVWYSGVTRFHRRPILIGGVKHIYLTLCSNQLLLAHRISLTKHLYPCSSIGGPSVYQSVRRVSRHPGGDVGHTPPGDPEWTHPRIQGEMQENKHTNMKTHKEYLVTDAHKIEIDLGAQTSCFRVC